MIHLRVHFLVIIDIILVFAAVIGTLGALITAFGLPVYMLSFFVVLLLAAIAFSFITNILRYKGLLIIFALVLVPIVLFFTQIISGAQFTIFLMTRQFTVWTFIPVLFYDTVPMLFDITIFFIALGLVLTALVSMSICIRLSTVLTILITIPFSLITFILLGNPPDFAYILTLVGVYFTLLISNMLKSGDGGSEPAYVENLMDEESQLARLIQGRKAPFFVKKETFSGNVEAFTQKTKILPALLIAVLLMSTAWVIAPQNTRANIDFINNFNHNTRAFFARLGLIPSEIGVGWLQITGDYMYFDTELSRISDAGARIIYDIELVDIIVTEPGIFYLRGFSLDDFDGRSWRLNPDKPTSPDEELSRQFPAMIAMTHALYHPGSRTAIVDMTLLHTGDRTYGIKYIPYFSDISLICDEEASVGDDVNDGEDVIEDESYAIKFFHNSRRSIRDMYRDIAPLLDSDVLADYTYFLNSTGTYRDIHPSTAEALRQIAASAGININSGREVVVTQVAEFIVRSGTYSHTPPRTPDGTDFALFFLEVSQVGYCIHFATAATLMLRALDIPARFTTGYLVYVSSRNVGQLITLTDMNAHAWVEVYFEDIGWIPLEVTPASAPGPGGAGIPTQFAGGAHFPDRRFDPLFMMDWEYYEMFRGGWIVDDDLFFGGPGMFDDGETDFRDELIGIIIRVISILGISFIIMFARVFVIRALRKKQFAQPDTNAAVISMSRYMTRLLKRGTVSIDDDIEELALKAYFSQHTITKEERTKVLEYSDKLYSTIYNTKNIFGKFVMNFIFAL